MRKLTDEEILLRGAAYASRNEFSRKSQAAYKQASRRNLLDQLYPSKNRNWSKDEDVLLEGRKYSCRSEFEKESNAAYTHARKRNLLDRLYPSKKKDWSNDEDVLSEGQKYSGRTEFQQKSGSAYRAARLRGLLDLLYPSKYGDWTTDEAVIMEGSKYKSRSEFHRYSLTAFEAASSRNLLDKIHPVSLERTDNDAIYIWQAVGQYYNGNPVYKIGITSARLGTRRIEKVAAGSGFDFELICCEPVQCKATDLEKKLLILGEDPEFQGFDGCTEFRALSNSALYAAVSLICGAIQ